MKFNKGDIVDVRGWVVYEQDEDGEVGVALYYSDDAAVFVKPGALTLVSRTPPPPGSVVKKNGNHYFVVDHGELRDTAGDIYYFDILEDDYEVVYRA